MSNKYLQTNDVSEEQGSDFDYREIWTAVILHWHWFVISVVACLVVAFLYLRYTAPVYTTWTELLIKEDDPYARRMQGGSMLNLSQMGIMTNTNGFDNEVEILGSKTLAKRAVTGLKLYVTYAYEGTFRDKELYRNSPLTADMAVADLDTLPGAVRMEVTMSSGEYLVKGEAARQPFETTVKEFPAQIKTASGVVMLTPNPGYAFEEKKTLVISIYKPSLMAEVFMGRTTIESISKMTTIARVSMNDTQTKRAEDYLNELTRVYNEDANESKNEVALKTEVFINDRINKIDKELGFTESDLEAYKKANSLVDLTSDAQAAYGGIETYQKQQVELQTQMMLVKSLMDYVDNPNNMMQLIPANLGLNDQALNRTIGEYNELALNRMRLLKSASETSPAVVSVTNSITALWPGIQHSLQTVYDNLRVQKRSVDEQYKIHLGRLSNAPTQERRLNDIGRQREVRAALYQILLQKREENSISLASTAAKAQVIDAPESSMSPVAPKKKMVGLMAVFFGLALPSTLLYILHLLRYRIEARNDIEKLTDIPVLADIFVAKDLKEGTRGIVIRENSNDIMEEAFRNLRTNLGFVMSKSEKVLLCTSVIPGEGKTFISTNLAMSMALMGRKVLVVGLDIRKPRLSRLFGLKSGSAGLTTYLIGEDNSDEFLRSQIFNSGIHSGLDVLPAGLIPPNPGELITSVRLERAFERLREWYDTVIIDTPPLGLVSDTLLLGRLADASLLVCRCDFSLKRNFELVNALRNENKLPNMNLVLNGVDLEQRKYGYYYGYGRYGRYGGQYGSYGKAYGSSYIVDNKENTPPPPNALRVKNGSSKKNTFRTMNEDEI